MADPQLVQEWLDKAEEDFGFAASVIKESPYYAQICFHFHQAATFTIRSAAFLSVMGLGHYVVNVQY